MITATAPQDYKRNKRPAPVVMTETQLRGMLKFATKAERAYRACGDSANAAQAQAHRERIEAELEELQRIEAERLIAEYEPAAHEVYDALRVVSMLKGDEREWVR
jgi:hypothetical protein